MSARRWLMASLLLGPWMLHAQEECEELSVPETLSLCEGEVLEVDWSDEWLASSFGQYSLTLNPNFPGQNVELGENGDWDVTEDDAGEWEWTIDWNGPGPDWTCTGTLNVVFNENPQADFSVSGAGQCSNLPFSFTNLSTGNGPLDYEWSFGSGGGLGSSSAENPVVELPTVGGGVVTIPVGLEVIDVNGCTAQVFESVAAQGIPNAGFIGEFNSLCALDSAQTYSPLWPSFNSNSVVTIDWGDGSLPEVFTPDDYYAGQQIGHGFETFGEFDVTITVEAENGCVSSSTNTQFVGANPQVGAATFGGTTNICGPEELVFELNNVDGNDPTTIYIIDWGDGSDTDTLQHPPPAELSHIYSESSCGSEVVSGNTTINNSFYFSVVAQNLCDQSAALITPVRINTAPEVNFDVAYEWCEGDVIEPNNSTIPGEAVNANGCVDNNTYLWLVGPPGAECFDIPNPNSCCALPDISGNCAQSLDFSTTINAPGEYQIELTASNSCDTDSMVQPICVVPFPEPAFALPQTEGCAPFVVTPDNLSNTLESCGVTDYYWIITDLSQDKKANQGTDYLYINQTDSTTIEPELEFLIPGCYTVELRAENKCGPVKTEPVQITVSSPPIAMLSGGSELCEGGQLTFTGSGSAGNETVVDYQWTLDGVDQASGQFLFPECAGDDLQDHQQPFTFNAPGTFTIEFEVTNSCGTQVESSNVTVYPLPELVVIPEAPEACEGDSVWFEASGADNYQWDFDSNPLGAEGDSAGGPLTTNLSGSVTGTVGYGVLECSATVPIEALVLELPQPSIALPALACDGDDLVATSTVVGGQPAYVYVWSGAYGTGAGSTLNVTADEDASGSIQLLVTDIYGCQGETEIVLPVLPLPVVLAGPDLTLCDQPITEQLGGFSPSGGTWTGPGIVNGATGVFDPAVAGLGTTELTYTYVDGNGCENSDVMEVSVVEPQVAEAGPDVVICDVDTSVMFVDFTPTTLGTWSGTGVINASTGQVNAGPLTPGDYTYTYEYGTGTCYSVDTRTLTVLERPVLSLSAVDPTVCTGETAVFTASVSGGQGPYVFSWGGNVTPGATTATATSATAEMDLGVDPFTATLLVTDANGCTDEATVSIDVLELPVVLAGPDLTLCDQPITEQLGGFSPSGGTWTGPGIVNGATGVFDPAVAGLGTTELTYTYVDGNGCENSDVMEVSVVEPQVAEAGPDVVICDVDTSVMFVDFTPTTLGTWSGTGVINASTGQVNAGPLTPGDYTYTYEYGTGTCYSVDTRTLTVLERPVLSLSAVDPTVCTGETAVFTASVSGGQGPYVFSWGGNVTPGATTATATSATAEMDLGVDPFTATLLVTDANGCTDEATVSIDVLELPVVLAGPDLTLCDQPITEQLGGFSPSGGTWTGPGIVNGAMGVFDPAVAGLGTTELTYTYVDGNGCENSDVMEVSVVEPQVAEAGPDVVICDVDTSVMFVDFTPTTLGTWSGTGVINASTGQVNAGPLTPGDYTYTYEYGTGTCYSVDTRTLTVLERPVLSLSAVDPTVCTGETAVFTASVSGGQGPYVFSWGGNVTPGATTATATSATAEMDLGVDPFTATLLVTDANGCTDEATVSIDVLELPVVLAGPDLTLCDQPITEQLGGFSPSGGTWTGPGIVNGATGVFDPAVAGLGTTELTYTYVDGNGCENSDVMEVSVVEPQVAEAGPDVVICDVDTSVMFVDFTPTTLGTWSGTGVINASTGQVNAGPLTPGDYTYTYEYGTGTCYSVDTRTLTVLERPVLSLSAVDPTVCTGETAVFTASVSGGQGPYVFSWGGNVTPGATTATATSATAEMDLGVDPFTATLLVTDANGCTDEATVSIDVLELPVVSAGLDTVFCDQPIAGTLEGFSPGLNELGTGYWTGLGGAEGALTGSGSYDPSLSGLGVFDAVYTYTADATGCTHTDTIQVTVTEPVVADAGLDTTVCDNAYPLQLEGYFPTSGVSWSGMSPAASAALLDGETGLISPDILTPGSYDYLLEFGYGTCYTRDTVTVTVDALPVITLASDDVFCVNDGELLLTTFTPTGGTWEGPGVVDAGLGVFEVDATETGVGNYDLLYWYEDPQTGCRDTVYHEVLVQDIPVVDAGLDTVFCDQPIAGTLEGFSPGLNELGTGYWTGLGGAEGALTGSGSYDPSLSGLGVFDAVYTYTADATGCTHTDTIQVTVTEPVVADAGLDTTVCDNAYPLQLEGYFPTSGVSWSGMSPAASAALLDSETGLISPDILTPGIYDYLMEYGIGTCYTRDTVTVTVDALPVITLASDDVFCVNDGELLLTTFTPTGGTWEGPGVVDAGLGVFEVDATETGVGNYDLLYWYEDPQTGCRDTVYHEVLVQDIPVVDAGLDTVFCDQPIAGTLEGFSPGLNELGTGYWTGLGGAEGALTGSGSYDPSLSGLGVFDAVYTYTADATGCTHTDTIQVTVTEPVVADAGLDTTVCDNAYPLQLEGYFPTSGVSWSGMSPAASAALLDGETGLISPDILTPGSYDYLLEFGYGTCYTRDTVTVTVDALPVITLASDDVFCVNDGELLLTTFTPTGGTWEGPGVVDAGLGVFEVDATETGVGNYDLLYWYEDPQTGCRDTVYHEVLVQDIPVVDAGLDTVFCDQPIAGTLEGFSPGLNELGTGYWTGLGGAEGALTGSGSYDPSLSGLGVFDAVYTYTADATGCTHTDTIQVTVTEPVVADAGLDTTVCDNAYPLQLEGYFPTSGVSWSGMSPAASAALLDSETGLISPDILTPGSYDYLLEFGYGTCYTRDTVTVTVDALPVITLASDDVFCVNDGELLLTTFTPTGGTWEGPGVVDAGLGVFEVDATETGVGNYDLLYWYEDPQTGCRDTVYHEVLVQDIPVVDAGLDTVFCDQPIAGTLEGFSPGLNELGTGYWTGLGGAEGALTGSGSYDPSLSGLGVFDAVYTYTADATGCTHTDTIQVTVTEPVVADAGLDTTVCDNAYPLQLEGYFPTSGVSWSGMSPAASAALLDSETGLISPDILTPGIYDYLMEYGIGTCYTRDTVTVNVDALPVITPGPEDAFCANLGVQSMSPMDPLGGTWYGPGVVNEAEGGFQTAQPPGDYVVNYWYQDPLTGCRDTAAHVVEVLTVPVSAFLADTLGCSNLDLPLSNESEGAVEYLWTFGTGFTSEDVEPSYTYPGDGFYDLILYATNALGCTDTSEAVVEITHPPTADFILTPDSGCAPLEVEFTNVSDAPYSEFLWTINAVLYPQEAPPLLNFQQGDSILDYAVLLQVENLCGQDQLEDSIKVFPTPQMDFVLSEDTVCSPYEMVIVNTSVGLPDDVTWDFGDGTGHVGPDPPPHFYSVDSLPQVFDITVVGVNECGVDDTTLSVLVKPNVVQAFFTVNSPVGCAPYELEVTDFSVATTDIAFDFDNGDFANDSVSTTVYTDAGEYDITQYVTNGCSYDTVITSILVHPAPDIALSVSEPAVCEEDFFFFEAVVDDPGDVVWDFGDGFQFEGLNSFHAYDSAGQYWVSLDATAALTGCPNQDSLLVTVHANPVIDVDVLPEVGCHPLEVTLDNATTGSSFQTWNFSDGSEPSFEYAPVHVFENSGLSPVTFPVFLTAESAEFCSSSAVWNVTVLPTPQADFVLEEETSCSYPVPVSVTNLSVGSQSHDWSFDGVLFSGYEPSGWEADGVGVYPVQLTATNSYGCADVQQDEFEVFLPPTAGLDAAPYAGCNPLTVTFSDASFNSSDTYLSIDGVYDGPLPSSVVLDEVGDYQGVVTVISPDGCTDTLSLSEQFEVFPVPVGSLDEPVCALNMPEGSGWCTEYRFADTTASGVQYQWYFSDGFATTTLTPELVHDFGVDELEHSVLVILQNEFGCPDTLYREFEVISELEVFVPNAFMPTADWPNNVFMPVFNAPGRVENYEFVIFNRWGSEVFRTEEIGTPWIGDGAMPWNTPGTHYAKDDVYNWILTYRDRLSGAGGRIEKRGMVVLLR